jgi:peptide/nickel transport system substrate-binding protein
LGRFLAVLCAAALGATLAPSASAQPRDTVIVGLLGEPDHLVPGFSRLAVAGHVNAALFVGLVGLNVDLQAYPRVAAEIPTLENGQWRLLPNNEMEVTYKIRPGFKWHDGTPVTAGDAVFAWEVAREPRTGAIAPDTGISAMTAPDPATLVVRWRERRAQANIYAHSFLPRHLLGAQFRENPAVIRTGAFAQRLVGNGPYRLVEWMRGRHVRMQAVEDYVEGRPAIPTLIFRFFPSAAAVGGEEVHVNFTGAGGGPQFESLTVPGLIFEHIAINLDSPLLRDRRVRQALLHAVDREAIRRQAGWVTEEVAHTWLPPRHPMHNPNARQYGYDPDTARRLLAEAGWTPGPDGVLRNAAGDRFGLVLMTTRGDPRRERTQDLVIAQWRTVGVAVRKDNPDNFFDMLFRRQFPHLGMFAFLMHPVETGWSRWHSSMIPTEANRFQGGNYYGWRHAENDRLLEQAGQEMSDSRRDDLMRRQQEVWVDALPALPLWFRNETALVHRNLQGVKPVGVGGGYTWNVHDWAWRP